MQSLLGSPREALDADELSEALALGYGARIRHGVDVLDFNDKVTGEVLQFESGGSVTWSYRAPDRVTGQTEDLAAVRRQASLTIPTGITINLLSSRLRIWTEWQLRSGVWARFYLGVFTITNPGARVDDGLLKRRTLQLADKSYLWANKTITEPVYVSANTDILGFVKSSATSVFGETSLAMSTAGDGLIADDKTFEAGVSYLEMWSTLLQSVGNDQVTADELGRLTSRPSTDHANQGSEATYGAGQGKILTAGQVEPLLPSLPNVLRFSAQQGPTLGNVEGNGLRTVKNQSTGPASIDARGYEVELRVDVEASDQDALDAIAYADAQRYFAGGGERFSGSVALNPLASDRDVVTLSLPRLDIVGVQWQVTEWTYPLGDFTDSGSALMPIVAERRVALG